jgi:alpha-galactosidase
MRLEQACKFGASSWQDRAYARSLRAVLLLNRRSTSAEMSVHWNELGLDPSTQATVKDVWAGRELGSFSVYSAAVPAGDAMLLLVRGTDAKETNYAAVSPANILTGGATAELCGTCASGRSVALGGEKTLTFKIAPFQRPIFVQIHYINPSGTPLTAQLRVGDSISTNVLFPPAGAVDQVGSITVEVEPGYAGKQSALVFSSPCATGPALESVSVLSSAD